MSDEPHLSSLDKQSLQEPFFLVGAQRSGSTLLRLMIDHHPQIRFRFESNFLVDHLTPEGNDPEPSELQTALSIDRGANLHGFRVREGHGFKSEVRHFLSSDAREQGKSIFGTALHRRFADILHIWPNARFIHLIRDPRDVAPSVIAMGWSGNTWHASRLWLNAQQEAQALSKSLPPGRWHTVRFEDLVSAPVDTLTGICTFLGCEYNSAMLSYPEDTTYPAPDASAAQRWRKSMSRENIQLVEASVGTWLQAAGYESSSHAPLKIGSFKKLVLSVQNRLQRLRFRINRYGLFTVTFFALSSRLRLTAFANRLQQRMQAHDNTLLR